ncbi:MAG TPA: hypothetical protein VJ721_07890 [Chthoniobacterales bacterium]|nr:hypothetical protein [Chthoniobacterales bacterium]
MHKLILIGLIGAGLEATQAQDAPTGPRSQSDMEALRQQVQALTDTVKALQQQVKDQQTTINRFNQKSAAPDEATPPVAPSLNEEPNQAGPSNSPSPSPSSSPKTRFPTEDTSVVSSTEPATSTPQSPGVNANGTAVGNFPTTDSSVVSSAPADTISTSGAGASLTQPIGIGSGKNYMNISFDGLFALAGSSTRNLDRIEVGDHDPMQRGFNARNIELALDGAVDPYFEGFANIVFKPDNDNQTDVEVEEAFLQTTSLPFNLQLKGGQFFAAFGRINPTHPHTWDFADYPIVAGRFLGPDGLRGVGTQISWVAPVPWYSQLSLGVQNGRGETGYSFRNPGDDGMFFGRRTTDREIRGLEDFVWIPRWENSIDLSPTQVVLAGVSGAFGSNETGGNARTQIYGADLLYKWKSEKAEGGFPFVKWQTEFMYRRFEAGRGVNESFPVAETFNDWGLYSQVLWGFKKGWVAGIRGDYYDAEDSRFTNDLDRQSRSRISANLTWYPTEFSKIRLQYNHDFLEDTFFLAGRDVDSVFLQFEFILGAHGAHKF